MIFYIWGLFPESQKFRCEVLRTIGIVFCSPFCTTILQMLLPMEIYYGDFFIQKFITSTILMIGGMICIGHSYEEMERYDTKHHQ